MYGEQRLERRDQVGGGKANRCADAQLADHLLVQSREPLMGRTRRIEHGSAALVERLAGVGQREVSRRSPQERYTGFALELSNLLADGRRRQSELARGATHRSALDHGGQQRHPLQVHC